LVVFYVNKISHNLYDDLYDLYEVHPRLKISQLTLEGVKDGKEVHERQVEGAPGEEGEAPGEAQEDHDARHAAHVLQRGAVLHVVRVLPLQPTQLHQHHDEHGDVENENHAEIRHHRHVERDVVLQPAAEEIDGRELKVLVFLIYRSKVWGHPPRQFRVFH